MATPATLEEAIVVSDTMKSLSDWRLAEDWGIKTSLRGPARGSSRRLLAAVFSENQGKNEAEKR